MLRPDELASIRGTVNGFLPDSCVINRGGTALDPQPTMPDGSHLRCRVRPDTRENTPPGVDSTQTTRRWVIRLPDGIPVHVGDQVVALGNTYTVVELENPESYSVSSTVLAWLTADGSGTPPYLRFNAVVTIKKGTTVKLSAVPAMIETPGPETQPSLGGIVKYVVLLAPLADVNDCRGGDSLLIDSWGVNAVDTAEVYYVFESAPDGPLGMERQRLIIGYRQMNG